MTAHRISSIRIDQFDGVTPVLDCLAEPGAGCRFVCLERCDAEPYDPAATPPDGSCCLGCIRPLVAYSGCVVADWWMDADEYVGAYTGEPHPFVPGPIEFSVDSGRYVWRYADKAGPDPEAATS